MVVQHNLTAMNSNRMLGITAGAQAKSTEKLSSGYKINRAADDAAGLAISEKMRRQIKGLTQASANAQDGISCVQTAEGALAEVHDMLQRMNTLAIQASNDTMTSVDRGYLDSEVQALVSEIDRVASTTTFNEQNLLDGTFTGKNLQVGAEKNQFIGISISEMRKINKRIKNGENPEDMCKAGIDYAICQIRDLQQNDVDGIHIYTMNKPAIAEAIVGAIR